MAAAGVAGAEDEDERLHEVKVKSETGE